LNRAYIFARKRTPAGNRDIGRAVLVVRDPFSIASVFLFNVGARTWRSDRDFVIESNNIFDPANRYSRRVS
jgi:hypothetical protein